MLLDAVPTTVAIASGKGGVGKTFIAVELAKTLADLGAESGVLDIDLTTPDSDRAADPDGNAARTRDRRPRRLRAGSVAADPGQGTAPTQVDDIQVVSKGFELPEYAVNTNDERMQLESAMTYIRSTEWAEGTTHVVVDTPPGTGWEIQTVLRDLRPDFGFVVTTGTVNSVRNACRTHELFRRAGLDHAIIANMRRSIPSVDHEALRNRLATIQDLDEATVAEIIDAVDELVGAYRPLHDDGIDLSDRFSAPVVADVPFTDSTDRVRDELRRAIKQCSLASTLR